jgi:DNA-binding NtrC family response regulator
VLHLLLIDDNPTALLRRYRKGRLLSHRELERDFSPLRVTEVTNAADFEQALAAAEFDLVITDFQLHWSDRLKILSAVKTRNPQRPVIVFTNTGDQETAVAAMKAGLDDDIIKSPKHSVRLAVAARAVLDRAAAQQRNP